MELPGGTVPGVAKEGQMGAVKCFPSKYESLCKVCKGWVAVGEMIHWEPGVKGVSHAVCPAVPAAPPAVKEVPIAEEVAALRMELSAASGENLEAAVAAEAAKVAWVKAAEAAGACFSCNGSGSVWHFDCDYPCSHENAPPSLAAHGSRNPYEVAKVPEVAPLYEAHEAASKVWHEASELVKSLERKLEELEAPRKGSVCVAFKGRKVKVGSKVKVVWVGEGNWGPQAKVLLEGGAAPVYVALGNLKVISHEVKG